MTTINKNYTTIQECRYCDSSALPSQHDGVPVCSTCGAEWSPVPVQAEVSFCHYHQEILLHGEDCYTCQCEEDALHDDHDLDAEAADIGAWEAEQSAIQAVQDQPIEEDDDFNAMAIAEGERVSFL